MRPAKRKLAWVAFGWPRCFHAVYYFGDLFDALADSGSGFAGTTECGRYARGDCLVGPVPMPHHRCKRCEASMSRREAGK